MYQTSLFFKLKDSVTLEKHRILEIFFKSWVDDVCNNDVDYTLVDVSEAPPGSFQWEETYRVDFEYLEDALALKLRDVPLEFKSYIEMVH